LSADEDSFVGDGVLDLGANVKVIIFGGFAQFGRKK
jgi:hypothetical protein